MAEEKTTKHNVIVRLLSPTKITYDKAVFKLASCLDKEALEDNGLLIVGYDFDDAEPGANADPKRTRGGSKLGSKLGDLAARSPGVIGDFMALLKGRSARDLYIGFCGVVLFVILISKWVMRLISGTF